MDLTDNAGWSALHLSIAQNRGSLPLFSLILRKRPDVNLLASKANGSKAALHLAAAYAGSPSEHPQAEAQALALMQAPGVDLDLACGAGLTPLLYTIRYGSPVLVEALLKHGADPNKPDGAGLVPLHVALCYNGACPDQLRARRSGDRHARHAWTASGEVPRLTGSDASR